MNPQKARAIQSKGGKASKLTHEQAQAIGRKGGLARARKRKQQEQARTHNSSVGRSSAPA